MSNIPDWAQRGRSQWEYYGQKRPSFAINPTKNKESVWDYPRPPRIDHDSRHILVKCDNLIIADTTNSIRILETASPPTFYLPTRDINFEVLRQTVGSSKCEWKGSAIYWELVNPCPSIQNVGWSYTQPFQDYSEITNHLSFYPGKLACFVDGERVRPQPGSFYGGWITNEIVGPVKGEDPRAYL